MRGFALAGWDAVLWIVVSGLLDLLYFVLLDARLARFFVARVSPRAGNRPALSVVGAILILGERPPVIRWRSSARRK